MDKILDFWHCTSYVKPFRELMSNLKTKYGQEIFNMSGIGNQLDTNYMGKDYFKTNNISDTSVDSNANVGDNSVIGYVFESNKPSQLINSYYRLWKWLVKNRSIEYANFIVERQISGELYINDFHGISSSRIYCFNYSTYDTALNGIPEGLDPKGGSVPPKYLCSFKEQIILFSLIAGNSTLGAVGLADLLIVLSLYFQQTLKIKGDEHFKFATEDDCWAYLRAKLTTLVYILNQPYRGNQSLFTNISVFDDNFLKELCPSYSIELNGEFYTAEVELVKKIQYLFLDIMNKELERRALTFPITTACCSVDDEGNILDEVFLDNISYHNLKFGFINIYTGKSSTLSSCCRLRSDISTEYFNAFGSGSTKIGSIGVVTGNLPRLAEEVWQDFSKDGEVPLDEDLRAEFLKRLKTLVIDCQEINNAKRNIVKNTIKNGNCPLYDLGYMDIKKQYSTFGVVGLNEALEILVEDILSKSGQDFVIRILDTINETNDELQKRFKYPHNCEQIPAENVAVKLAKKDKLLGMNNNYEMYSNQFIPLVSEANLLDRIELQGMFDKHFSGGAICHLNIDQQITDVKKMKNLILAAAKKGVVYFAINYVLQRCEKGHFTVGNVELCPKCQSPIVDIFTRVVGFLTKVKDWNKTRREFDFPNRKFYEGI